MLGAGIAKSATLTSLKLNLKGKKNAQNKA